MVGRTRGATLIRLCACVFVLIAGPAGAEPVAWTSLVNAVVNGTTLQRSGCEWCVGGAVSAQTIPAGDGYVEFTVSEINTARAAGLSNGNTDTSVGDIDFAVSLNGAGYAEVRENGIYKWDISYAAGDLFRVAVVGTQVNYSKNGVVFYTSGGAPRYPLLMDASLGSVGATLSAATIAASQGSGGTDVSPPVRSNGQPSGTLPAGTTTTTLSLTTNEASVCRHATSPGIAYGTMTGVFSTTGGTSHSTTLTGLASGSTFTYYVRCQDTVGNANPDDFPIAFSVASSSGLPGQFEQALLVGGLGASTAMDFASDGRLFVAEQAGRIRVIKNGVLLATPFATVNAQSSFEQGLLGITFDPNFATNRYVYVFYTSSAGQDRVSRFTASTTNPDVAAAGSELVILDNILQTAGYHDGGAIHFGTDGKLYVAVGDGSISSNAQSLSSLGGKLLRIDPSTFPNIIPSDNPFVSTPGARGEIWAMGFRNPFTFAVDPTDGRIHVNDVGNNEWEEINLVTRGGNYGWPTCEGVCSNPAFVNPIHTYNHAGGQAAVTGGAFYRGSQFPSEYRGNYFFSDYTNGFIRRLDAANQPFSFLPSAESPVDLKVGPDGQLYYLSIYNGAVYTVRFVGTGNRSPTAVASATPTSGAAPLGVTFTSIGSNDPDGDALEYVWSFGDGSPTTTGPTATHTYLAAGLFDAVLTVDDRKGGSATSTVPITVGQPPHATITRPIEGTTYSGGDTISFEATADDAEDGPLPASAFSWTIRFHHLDHLHPFLGPIDGVRSGSFAIPQTGEADYRVWYRIILTVTDSSGLTAVTTRDVLPNTSTITLTTAPSGPQLTLDGQPVTTPHSFTGVVGIMRTIGAPAPQTLAGRTYGFTSWSDGGSQTHTIQTPATATTYSATYTELPSSTQNVVWTSLVNAVVNGTTLQRTGCESCRGGAISSQTIGSGDGYVEFAVAEVNTGRAAGLSNGNTDTTVADIDFAVSFNGAGSAEVRENGTYRWSIPYNTGDIFRVAVTNNQVRYSKNSTVFYTSTRAPVYPLLMDASLGSVGSTISNAIISSGASGTPDTTPPVRSNGQPSGTLPTGTTSASLSLTTNESATCRYATTAGVSFSAMANTFSTTGGASHSTTVTGLSAGAFTFDVRCQDALGNANADDFSIAFSVAAPSGGPENVSWTNLVNAVVNGTTLQRAGCEWCVGGAVSVQTITAGDGYVEFTVTETNTGRAAGLSTGNTDTSVADIDFAIALNGAGYAEVRENGLYRWDIAYAAGDVFRVAVVSNQVRYSKNGVVFFTTTKVPTYPLLFDTSLGNLGATISNGMISR